MRLVWIVQSKCADRAVDLTDNGAHESDVNIHLQKKYIKMKEKNIFAVCV